MRRVASALISACLILAAPACGGGVDTQRPVTLHYQDEVLKETSLLAYWRLNDAAGTSAANLAPNNALPSGSYSGGFTLGQAGPFTDPANPDTAVQLNAGSVLMASGFSFGQGDLTIEIWVKSTQDCSSAAPGIYLGFQKASSANFALYCRVGYNHFDLKTSTGDSDTTQLPITTMDGNWHYFVGTRQQNVLSLYIDGKLAASKDHGTPFTGVIDTTQEALIGTDGIGDFVSGSFSEAAIYGSALPAVTVLKHYNLAQGIQ